MYVCVCVGGGGAALPVLPQERDLCLLGVLSHWMTGGVLSGLEHLAKLGLQHN